MITLSVRNGKVYVWNADDWLKLREDHRIVSELIGCLAHLPRQDIFQGLPATLLPEEVTLLLEKGIITLFQYPSLSREPGPGVKAEYENYRMKIYEEQAEYMLEERKKQISDKLDEIVEGKRAKLLGIKKPRKKKKLNDEEDTSTTVQTDLVIDRDAVLKEELSKIKRIELGSSWVQIFTVYPWLRKEDACPVDWTFPRSSSEKLRYKTFKALWEKQYFLTTGEKFGADYLVYPGDPVKFHALCLVICIEKTSISMQEIVAYGRLGSSVRKTVVLAYDNHENEIVFQSVSWFGTKRLCSC